MKILCTGAAGFIGRTVCARLLAEGHELLVLDRVLGHDLSDRELLEQNIVQVDQVIHLAAIADLNVCRERPNDAFETNIRGTWNVAEFCAKYNKRLLFASTCCVYGDQDFETYPETHEDVPLHPNEIYAHTKVIGEHIMEIFKFTHNLNYVNMRFATIYGEPGMREALGVKKFFLQSMAGELITVHGTGDQTRTLTYVGDLAEAVTALVERIDITNTSINLSTEESISANEMAEKIKAITGSSSEITHIRQRAGQTMKEAISAKRAKELLGWEAKTSFDEGVQKVWDYLKKQ